MKTDADMCRTNQANIVQRTRLISRSFDTASRSHIAEKRGSKILINSFHGGFHVRASVVAICCAEQARAGFSTNT